MAALTSVDQLITGMQPSFAFIKNVLTNKGTASYYNYLYCTGMPGNAAYPTSPTLSGNSLTTPILPGCFNVPNAPVGNTQHLAHFSVVVTSGCSVLLVDRVWHNSGIVATTTTAQTINSVAFPARDNNGSANGEGYVAALEVTASATTNAANVLNTTISYTNSDNVSGRTATLFVMPSTSQSRVMNMFSLQSGDKGIKSIESLTLGTSYGTGSLSLCVFRIIAKVDASIPGVGTNLGVLDIGLPRIYDDSNLHLIGINGSTANSLISGTLATVIL